jgi:predicted ATPase/tetratricopeptide (TPR) repeat protein
VTPGASPRTTAPAPDPSPRLVGRDGELDTLVRRFAAGERLVTLLGPPGIGKTALALRFARDAAPRFPGGVFFVDLAEAGTPAELAAAVARALGIPIAGPPDDDGRDRLGAVLAGRGRVLLLLDGAERLADTAAAVLDGWLAGAPETRILVTSLVRLGARAEGCLEVPPLSPADGLALYEERAGRLGPGRLASRSAAEELVRRLDGVPLSIVLAAARVLSPKQLLARLDRDPEVLRDPGATGRHASLLSAIRCSWELLSPVEADALAQCAVFAGGFTLESAEGVLALAPGAPPVLDVIQALRDRSLLQQDAGDPPRFSMLAAIRAFARGVLAGSGGEPAARRRHAAHFAALADELPDGAPDTPGLARLVAERENLLLAHRHPEPSLAAGAALALAPVLAMQGPPATELSVLDAGVEAARQGGDLALLAAVLRARGVARTKLGFVEEAAGDLAACLARAREADARRLEVQARIDRGRLHLARGSFDEAREELLAGMAGARDLEAAFLDGYARNLLGRVAEAQRRPLESVPWFEAAVRLFRRTGRRRFEGLARMNLGVARSELGQLADADWLFEEARAVFHELGDRTGEADAVLNLGCVRVIAGRLDQAEPLLRRALELEREQGNRRGEAIALGNLGFAAQDRGELREALAHYSAAGEVSRLAGEPLHRATLLPFRGAVHAALGNLAEARRDFAEARDYFEALGPPAYLRTVAVLEVFPLLAEGSSPTELAGRLAEPEGASRSSELAIALRLAERALARRSEAAPGPVPEEERSGGIAVGPGARWFRVGSGEPVDLGDRRTHRRILQALADARLAAPGVGLSVERLFAFGWPGERALPTAAAARVYMAIGLLRKLGLGEVLKRRADGYLLDPGVALHFAGDEAGILRAS